MKQEGLVIAPKEVFEWLPKRALKVKDWGNNKSPATWHDTNAVAHQKGYMLELIFDAAHGRRYMLFIYKAKEGRKACWDFITKAE
jgi:hypothetical protein